MAFSRMVWCTPFLYEKTCIRYFNAHYRCIFFFLASRNDHLWNGLHPLCCYLRRDCDTFIFLTFIFSSVTFLRYYFYFFLVVFFFFFCYFFYYYYLFFYIYCIIYILY